MFGIAGDDMGFKKHSVSVFGQFHGLFLFHLRTAGGSGAAHAVLQALHLLDRLQLRHGLEQLGLRPRVVGEFEDSALMSVFSARGLGVATGDGEQAQHPQRPAHPPSPPRPAPAPKQTHGR